MHSAQYNMVEQQVRPWDVLEAQVLEVIASLPRDAFAPEAYRNVAYADLEIPLGEDARMLKPLIEGRMLQSLALREGDRVLEVGTGSGYFTACLAQLAEHVVSVEIDAALSEQAAKNLAAQGINNITLRQGNAAQGWPDDGPYDAIAVTGAIPGHSEEFLTELKIGGRLFVVTGDAPLMEAKLITRLSENEWRHENLFETEIPPLREAAPTAQFVF